MPETEYLAKHKLAIPNAPGITPSVVRVEIGERFFLDGNEPINVSHLIRIGAIELYQESQEQDELVSTEESKRQASAARPRMRTRRSNRNG